MNWTSDVILKKYNIQSDVGSLTGSDTYLRDLAVEQGHLQWPWLAWKVISAAVHLLRVNNSHKYSIVAYITNYNDKLS